MRRRNSHLFLFILAVCLSVGVCRGEDEIIEETIDIDLGSSREGSRTDAEVVEREENMIKLDGLNVAQIKEMRDKAEKFAFQAEVNRMMKLIINSLYRNKEIFLRELISNASDALDKIRVLSLTDSNHLSATPEFSIKIKADKDSKMLHITDTGIGMTQKDLVNNLGTIAKSGTAEFLSKMQESGTTDMNDLIGQFGVGFYSAFLVADRVIVTTKHNEDKQLVWESDANSFQIAEDPRGDSLKRGTQISLQLKDEAGDYLEIDTLRNLIKKYSQFITFPIYLWSSKTVTEEVPLEEGEEEEKPAEEPKDEEAEVEDADEKKDEDKPKTKKVDKTVWDWEIINQNKPIWTRKPAEIEDSEYNEFYKSLTKDRQDPLAKVHFVAEGEVTFKSLLFVPQNQPSDSFNRYGTVTDNIKLYVRRVFITDEFTDMLPKYLSFIQGVVDSDDLPLNVSRETLQQHKLLKVIRKKLVRKALDMIKKLEPEELKKFWKEYSTNIKLGVIEDTANRVRLAKLLRFQSSKAEEETTSLAEYVERMKPKQDHIYYLAGSSRKEVESSPFVERLLKKGYEVLYLVEAVDEYCLSSLPEFEGKKFQNVAKEGFTLEEDKKKLEALKEKYEDLTKWLNDVALKDKIAKAQVSERLTESPCALVASMFGWTGNMERLAVSNAHQKADDPQRSYYLSQRKTLEINPRHPLIKELQKRVADNPEDETAKNMALMMFRTATLRSGFMLQDSAEFAQTVEDLMRDTMGIPKDLAVDEEEDDGEEAEADEKAEEVGADEDQEEHDEL
ncbi:endoplasmin-like [Macrosteles quadrilineatus]|uniref:endoplasmin-like n=1 Tax=Macrosteles quadrilineatus TaxID=74068 RepID=UPI0023E2495A|nr:endoplasmin-like [Macrosteles quadrilineatus]